MTVCHLCRQERVLRNSHIVPEFLYGDLYNSKHQMMGIHGRGAKGWKVQQKGLREHLFCEACEQHFNEYFEKPFRRAWIDDFPLPDPWSSDDIHWIDVSYAEFKLFHLSVLYRAGVSSLPTFAEVSLGRHEDRLRRMLLELDAGAAHEYPIFGHAVVHHRTKRIVQLVSRAYASRFGGRRCYGLMYGGVQWWIGVASDRNHDLQQFALRPDGRMPIAAVPWNEIGVVQEMSRALRAPS